MRDCKPFKIDGSKGPEDFSGSWNAPAYEAAVADWIGTIRKHKTGNIVLSRIPDGTVTIVPEHLHAVACASYSHRVIEFTPGKRIKGSKSFLRALPDAGWSPDQSLLHESVHAMRDAAGFDADDSDVMRTIRVSFMPRVHPQELEFNQRGELFAITIVNVYWSERNPGRSYGMRAGRDQILLRADHASHRDLLAPQNLDENLSFRRALTRLAGQQPLLFLELARVEAVFNPFRDTVMEEDSGLVPSTVQALRTYLPEAWLP